MKLGLFSVLGIIFIVLKLVGTIAWSWWLVLMPFYIIPLIALVVLLFAACIKVILD